MFCRAAMLLMWWYIVGYPPTANETESATWEERGGDRHVEGAEGYVGPWVGLLVTGGVDRVDIIIEQDYCVYHLYIIRTYVMIGVLGFWGFGEIGRAHV